MTSSIAPTLEADLPSGDITERKAFDATARHDTVVRARHLRRVLTGVVESATFQTAVLVAIVGNAALIGIETYDGVSSRHASAINIFNRLFLTLFTLEIAFRVLVCGRPTRFFRSGWNVIDLCIVALAYLPWVQQSVTLLRLVRLLRLSRLLSVMPGLRLVTSGIGRSLGQLAGVGVLTFFVLYVYAIVGWMAFGDHDEARFGTVGTGLLTLFQLLTIEGWNEVLATEQALTPFSWIYFVSFIVLGSFLILNVVIAIVINSVEEARIEHRLELAKAMAGPSEERPGEGVRQLADSERLEELRDLLVRIEQRLPLDPQPSGPSPDSSTR